MIKTIEDVIITPTSSFHRLIREMPSRKSVLQKFSQISVNNEPGFSFQGSKELQLTVFDTPQINEILSLYMTPSTEENRRYNQHEKFCVLLIQERKPSSRMPSLQKSRVKPESVKTNNLISRAQDQKLYCCSEFYNCHQKQSWDPYYLIAQISGSQLFQCCNRLIKFIVVVIHFIKIFHCYFKTIIFYCYESYIRYLVGTTVKQ